VNGVAFCFSKARQDYAVKQTNIFLFVITCWLTINSGSSFAEIYKYQDAN